MHLTFGTFVKGQLFKAPKPVVKADLTGKTVIVLGANTGLGFEATKHFASMNAGGLILALRSKPKQGTGRAHRTAPELKTETGYGKAELWLVDLADFASVKEFADKFERDGGRLDILVENAGVGGFTYEPLQATELDPINGTAKANGLEKHQESVKSYQKAIESTSIPALQRQCQSALEFAQAKIPKSSPISLSDNLENSRAERLNRTGAAPMVVQPTSSKKQGVWLLANNGGDYSWVPIV
ncbi:hypothetical protein DFH06DRAFT_1128222 [Mycena polygramma]|nr:hypothetical protein DFH06DRAFT_1128222 [Mycena polygramma]